MKKLRHFSRFLSVFGQKNQLLATVENFPDKHFVALEMLYKHLRNGFFDFSIVSELQAAEDGRLFFPLFLGGFSESPLDGFQKFQIFSTGHVSLSCWQGTSCNPGSKFELKVFLANFRKMKMCDFWPFFGFSPVDFFKNRKSKI